MLKVFKVSERLSDDERRIGVIRISPVWGAKIDSATYFSLVRPLHQKHLDLLSPSEVGCTLAHMDVYREVVESNSIALVLESDVLINEEKLRSITELFESAPRRIDFLHLCKYEEFHFIGRKLGQTSIYRINPHVNFWGTAAYVISPRLASDLISFHSKALHRADDWSRFFRASSFVPYFSPVFSHPSLSDSSSIAHERETKKGYGSVNSMRISIRDIVGAVPRKACQLRVVRAFKGEKTI